jgi:signal transduction histidine kinase
MSSVSGRRWASAIRQVLRPPLRDPRFWLVQVVVIGLATAHLIVDIVSSPESSAFPSGLPVGLLLVPVGYAALRYGLSGSVATAVWATLLWLPDLLLPHDRGHPYGDLIELALVIAVAVFVGYHIDVERAERVVAQRARTEQQVAEARYRQLFDTNVAPILVASEEGTVIDANPAARALVPGPVIGRAVVDVLSIDWARITGGPGQVITLSAADSNVRYYRLNVAEVPASAERETVRQLVLADITEDRAEGDRAHRFAELLLKVQEEERRRIAQELHDEPLQLLVHLARTMERLEAAGGADPAVSPVALTGGLVAAREQALDIAARLRAVMSGLRPAALEQLGLIAALRGFLADLGETTSLRADLRVRGEPARLRPDIELSAFRIVQEATNNVIKHSAARRLMVTIAFADSELKLQVNDDGCGFDSRVVDGQLAAGHLGLLGMRERAMLVGGELTVHSQPGHGALVEATIPIGAPPRAAGMPAVHGQPAVGPVAS